MGDAGDRPLVPDLVRQRAAQAGQQRDADRARGAGDGCGDLVRDRLAQRRETERPAAVIGAGQQLRRGRGRSPPRRGCSNQAWRAKSNPPGSTGGEGAMSSARSRTRSPGSKAGSALRVLTRMRAGVAFASSPSMLSSPSRRR